MRTANPEEEEEEAEEEDNRNIMVSIFLRIGESSYSILMRLFIMYASGNGERLLGPLTICL